MIRSAEQTRARDEPATSCPGCTAQNELTFWRIDSAPVLCHGLCTTPQEARDVPRAPIELAMCRDCGLVYNRAFDPQRIAYATQYENALHFSPHFQQYAEQLAQRLVEQRGIRGGRVLEIGCGDGHFLNTLCRLGGNVGLGLDPAFDPQRSVVPEDSDVRIVAAPFDAQTVSAYPADLICCRHVLEHLASPMELLTTIRRGLDGQDDVLLYFEVPNLLHTLERMSIWDVIYEHCLYFTPATLRRMFRAAGYAPIEVGDAYGGQFAWIEATPIGHIPNERAGAGEDESTIHQLEDLALSFDIWCSARLAQMRQWLERLGASKRRAVVWGAGSKAVTMLNVLDVSDELVPVVIDQNPRKQGCYVVGTAQRIAPPEALQRIRPDTVIVMNPLYRDEVSRQLTAMRLSPEIIVP